MLDKLKSIDSACSTKDFNTILQLCNEFDQNFFGYLISDVLLNQRDPGAQTDGLNQYHDLFKKKMQFNDRSIELNEQDIEIPPKFDTKRVQLLCNWDTTENITKLWNKMSEDGNGKWGLIQLVTESPDYWVIINRPLGNDYFDPTKTIVFQMEPNMSSNSNLWQEWANPDEHDFLKVFNHQNGYNNIEWHLSKNYAQLSSETIVKDNSLSDRVSTILSDKYFDEGHIKRIDFVKYIENDIPMDVFGRNTFVYKNFKESLPYHQKDAGLFPYKYTFAAENNSIPNYFTEKITDAILSECLCFYWGCPNISSYIDSRAYIQLDLNDFESSKAIIQEAIANDEWSKRKEYIIAEKKRILSQLQFFPRLEHTLRMSDA